MQTKNDVRKVTRKLRCVLTADELLEAGKELAEATNELTEIEEDKKQIVAEFKSRKTAAEARIGVVSNKLRSGYEFRDVACEVAYGLPEPGMKQVRRMDTLEVIESVPLSEEEKQRLLELEQ
jgi:hypothetical protein